MINYEILVTLIVASWIVAKLVEAIKEPLRPWWEAASDGVRAGLQYVILAICGLILWFTGLDAFPGFSGIWAPLGRILTCLAGGFGPTFVYDLWMDRPTVPEVPS